MWFSTFELIDSSASADAPRSSPPTKTLALGAICTLLSACAAPALGPVARAEGLFAITRQGDGFWIQSRELTAQATQDAHLHCVKLARQARVLEVKETPAGSNSLRPQSEVLYRCD